MLQLLTPAEMGRADAAATAGGVAGFKLMQRAGWAVARAARRFGPCRTLVLCGPGNNGGDGYVAARLLAEWGWPVRVAALAAPRAGSDAARAALDWSGPSAAFTPAEAARADLVIDAVFGAGLSRPVDGLVAAALAAGRRILAVDVPSGVDGATGAVWGRAAQAAATVTFFRRKPGHLLLPGRDLCGELVVADIGIPAAVLQAIGPRTWANGPGLWRLPSRGAASHKYTSGVVTVMGGAEMTGAAQLSAMAARHGGAGMVTIAAMGRADVYRQGGPGLIVSEAPVAELLEDARRKTWVCGPGLGHDAARAVLPALLAAGRQVVADADALAAYAGTPGALRRAAVLTPHAGEFARLFGPIGQDRLAATRTAARIVGTVVLLKGSDTVIAAPDGRAAINTTGSAALATAGSGDVLSGLIAALLAGGLPPWEAACAGAWLHGRAGQMLGAGAGRRGSPRRHRPRDAGRVVKVSHGDYDAASNWSPRMSDTTAPIGLFDRAIRRITNVWQGMAASVSTDGEESIADQMRACVDGRGGEVSARNRAAKLAQTYLVLHEDGRTAFLHTLATLDSDPAAVAAAYAKLTATDDPAERATATAALRRALEPPRVRLLTQFTTIPDGMKFVVDLRATLLARVKGDPYLAALDSDLRALLANWFDVGFLELVRIDWSSPASLLERLVGYEAVHEIRSWSDLKNRLDSDRRCYALFHPRMPAEPLIFVEVALVKGLASNVQKLLDKKAPLLDAKDADTAIFYSISNCQRGLAGISFGNFLIKRAVTVLSQEYRNIKQFSTLSPIPGFRKWLDSQLTATTDDLLSSEETASLAALLPEDARPAGGPLVLKAVLAKRGWSRDGAAVKVMEPVLTRLAARYLLVESKGKRALDPVAHFHLSNGARVEKLTMLADTSDKGIKESATLMVNYLYDLAKIEDYHEDYAGGGKRNATTSVRRLARGWA